MAFCKINTSIFKYCCHGYIISHKETPTLAGATSFNYLFVYFAGRYDLTKRSARKI